MVLLLAGRMDGLRMLFLQHRKLSKLRTSHMPGTPKYTQYTTMQGFSFCLTLLISERLVFDVN